MSVWHRLSPGREPGALRPGLGSATGFPPPSNRRKCLTCAERVTNRRKHVGPDMVRPLWKPVWPFLRALKTEPTDDPATPLLGTEPTEPKAGSPRDTCMPRPWQRHSQSHRVEAAPRPPTGDGPSTRWTASQPQNGGRSWHPLHPKDALPSETKPGRPGLGAPPLGSQRALAHCPAPRLLRAGTEAVS